MDNRELRTVSGDVCDDWPSDSVANVRVTENDLDVTSVNVLQRGGGGA